MLGLYIHIPFCVRKCKYCDFNSFKLNIDEKKKYLSALSKEMELYKEKIGQKEIDSIFVGGGTPSILNEEEIKILFDNINAILCSILLYLIILPYLATFL